MYRTRIAAIFVVILALSGPVASAQEAGSTKVNVNTATPEELAHLPGMTKSKAAKVIAGRPYASADDLSKSGLTAKQIEKIKPLFRDRDEILIQSRDAKSLNRYSPELLEPLNAQPPTRCVLDGEIVVARNDGLDF